MTDTSLADARSKLDRLKQNLATVIQGKPHCLEILTIALLAGGSVLMEDVPGVGKTTLAKALARSVDLTFHRIQFTPDLLPADILGSSIYNPNDGSFHFRKGPIFCHVLLADEINRASPHAVCAAGSDERIASHDRGRASCPAGSVHGAGDTESG